MARPMAVQPFIGTWKLVSCEARRADGTMVYPYGRNPSGLLVYDAAGNVSVNLMDPSRPALAVADKARATPAEAQAVLHTYEAYFGTYHVDETRHTVTHHVEGSLLPNWAGSDQVRYYQFLPDGCLVLSTPTLAYGGTSLVGVLIWSRAA
jgi:hypothetical protein